MKFIILVTVLFWTTDIQNGTHNNILIPSPKLTKVCVDKICEVY